MLSEFEGYESIHGICFDEGMSGRCGLECRGFTSSRCEIPDEIIEGNIEKIRDDLLLHKFGELRLAVAKVANKVDFDEGEEIEKMLKNGDALEYFGY